MKTKQKKLARSNNTGLDNFSTAKNETIEKNSPTAQLRHLSI